MGIKVGSPIGTHWNLRQEYILICFCLLGEAPL